MPFEPELLLPPPSPPGRVRRSDRHPIFWLGGSVILVSGVLLCIALVLLREQALQSSVRQGETLAHLIGEQSGHTFQSVDQRLELATIALTELAKNGELNAQVAHEELREQLKYQPYLRALWILDAQGRIQFDSDSGNDGVDLSDRAYFQAFKAQQTGLYLGLPLRSRTTGRWMINLARPMPKANGQFAGVIVAALDLSYFEEFWRTVDLGQYGSITLLSRDGTLLVRSPVQESFLGKSFASDKLFSHILPKSPEGNLEQVSMIDGVNRLFSYRTQAAPTPFVVLVGQAKSTVLAHWQYMANVAAVIWGVASVAIALFAYLLSRAGRDRLRSEESQLRIFERITDAFVAVDLGWRFKFANSAAEKLLGRSPGSLIGKNIWDEFPADPDARIREACEHAMADQVPAHVEKYYPPLGRWFEIRAYPSPQGMTAYFQDVSARKQAEIALRASEARYRALFESNPLPMWVMELENLKFLAVNDAAVVQYGYSREEFLAMRVVQLRPPEDVPEFLAHLEENHEALWHHGIWRHMRKDGSTLLAEGTSHSLVFDGQPAHLVLANDVTQREVAQEALHISDQALKAVSQGVIFTNSQQEIVSVNDAFLSITGYERADVTGRNCRFLQGPLTSPEAVEDIRCALQGTHGFSGEILNYRKNGDVFWNDLLICPVRSKGGEFTHYVGITRDVSERKFAELALRTSKAQLRELSRRILQAQEAERRRMARELHDELGQSLTAMKINLQSHGRFGQHPPGDLNAENVRIIDELLQQVRSLALALRPSVLDDLGLVPALRWMAGQNATRTGLAVTFETDVGSPRFAPDVETACFRIAQEALTNVMRYAEASSVTVRLSRKADALVLTVADNGRGFDVEAMRQRAQSGGSLGVLGMQERTTLIGGQFTIESAPGAGTTICMLCPWQLREEELS